MKRAIVLCAALMAAALVAPEPGHAVSSGSFSAGTHARNALKIGIDLLHHGHYSEAAPYLETALNEYPDDTDILKQLAFAHRMIARNLRGESRTGELRLANRYYLRALDIDPNGRDLLEFMGELYLEMNDVDAAKQKLKSLEDRCPDGCEAREALARSIANHVAPPKAPEPPPPAATPAD